MKRPFEESIVYMPLNGIKTAGAHIAHLVDFFFLMHPL